MKAEQLTATSEVPIAGWGVLQQIGLAAIILLGFLENQLCTTTEICRNITTITDPASGDNTGWGAGYRHPGVDLGADIDELVLLGQLGNEGGAADPFAVAVEFAVVATRHTKEAAANEYRRFCLEERGLIFHGSTKYSRDGGCLAQGIEISEAYTAVTLQRLKDMGLEPRLADA